MWKEYEVKIRKYPDDICAPFSKTEIERLSSAIEYMGFEGNFEHGWRLEDTCSGYLKAIQSLSAQEENKSVLFTIKEEDEMRALEVSYIYRGVVQTHEAPRFDFEAALLNGWRIEANEHETSEATCLLMDEYYAHQIDSYQSAKVLLSSTDGQKIWVPIITRRMEKNPNESEEGFYWKGYFIKYAYWDWLYDHGE